MSANLEVLPDLTTSGILPAQAVSLLLDRALAMQASDLIFASNEDHEAIQVRHLGMVRHLTFLPSDLGQHCIAHIKAMAGMNMTERRRPQDGRWVHETEAGNRIDLRICTVPTLYGEDCSIRLLGRDAGRFGLEDLGLTRREYEDLLLMLHSPSGLLLVTGPTGCGKTTTLYACLQYLNTGERKINTIEEPIEYAIEGIRQSQVNPRIDLGFPELLRSVLRQAPDVIMVGEIRDATTAATAVYAANTGHLVLATLHATVAAAAVQSLRAWGVNSHFLAGALLGILAQRLLRTLCPECRSPVPVTAVPHALADLQHGVEPGQEPSLFAAAGCSSCYGTGYGGRTGVFEVMRISPSLRHLIIEGQPTEIIHKQAVQEGLSELRRSALVKVAQGQTTFAEVGRALPPEYLGLEV